ncbi:MAG TPA: exodeoxyribonuclease III [Patescibacteria group bacterium]
MKIISWNVNGIRAVVKKGLWEWMKKEEADIYCFQETKAQAEQVPPSLEMPMNYFSYWNSAKRPGYSGVATFTKPEPKIIINGMESEEFDNEGRVLITKYKEFTLLNVYFPNGKSGKDRLFYKMDFYEYFLNYINKLRDNGEKVIFCGDVNTAHSEIDLSRPKENETVSGFLPEEREWMDKLEKNGWIDTYRTVNGYKVEYSWWSARGGARGRNVGWRIDYFYIDEALKKNLKDAFIMCDVMGSDHCPVGIELKI